MCPHATLVCRPEDDIFSHPRLQPTKIPELDASRWGIYSYPYFGIGGIGQFQGIACDWKGGVGDGDLGVGGGGEEEKRGEEDEFLHKKCLDGNLTKCIKLIRIKFSGCLITETLIILLLVS